MESAWTSRPRLDCLNLGDRGMVGAGRKIASGRAIITDDYYSHYWGTLTEAIEESTGRNKLLGVGMSA